MKMLTYILLLLVVGCATTPEQQLDKGYKTSSATVKSTTVLLDRGVIPSSEAQRVKDLGSTSKAGLDAGKDQLAKCRATPGAVCDNTAASINLYSGVLGQLETYLKAMGVK